MYLSCVIDTFACPSWSAPIRADRLACRAPTVGAQRRNVAGVSGSEAGCLFSAVCYPYG